MLDWAGLEAATPEIAETGMRLLRARGGDVLLATVRGDELPRIHPVTATVVGRGLFAFVIVGSAKLRDLSEDGRYAISVQQDPAAPDEFALRGRARVVTDEVARAEVAGSWAFEVDEGYALVEFLVDSALVGLRPTADDWPPRYQSWSVAKPVR
ncbi:MAG: pyridoxamine 5'-phosphate oxidase family protein [Candidatus Limnocylindrales bacterium]